EVLPSHVSALLLPLRELIASLSIVDQLPQIELAIGQGTQTRITAMGLRIMAPLSAGDGLRLKAFADNATFHRWLQPAGPASAYQSYPAIGELPYTLPEFGIRMPFKPTDFTQVNLQINRVLVARALRLLDPQPGEGI